MNTNNREWSDLTININKMNYQNTIYLDINMQRTLPKITYSCRRHTYLFIKCRQIQLARLGREMGTPNSVHATSKNDSRRTRNNLFKAFTACYFTSAGQSCAVAAYSGSSLFSRTQISGFCGTGKCRPLFQYYAACISTVDQRIE